MNTRQFCQKPRCRGARLILSGALLVGAGCATNRAQLFPGMGTHHRPVTTSSASAQRYFDQGLVWCYGFNHAEAIRSFEEAVHLDPECAMAWWGIAYALGPNINVPADRERSIRARASAERALALIDRASPVERELIEAIQLRYADQPPEDRAPLDHAYAAGMRQAWHRHPDDADVGALFAESLLDLRPWDQWDKEGRPNPGTEEILATLDEVLKLEPNHPGANHFYIHALEPSPIPERATACADRLRTIAPGAGHLMHMPCHIYMRIGRYADVIAVNQTAVEVGRAYNKRTGNPPDHEGEIPHNLHFLAYGAMFDGQFQRAISATRELEASLTEETFGNPPWAEEVLPATIHVLVRFGRWEDILKEPPPQKRFPYTTALWHYARGVAFANTGRLAEAHSEAAAFEHACEAVPQDFKVFIVPAHDTLNVARHMLAGEIAFKEGRRDEAFKELREGVKAEDALAYNAPSTWMQPVRHALGALLLQAGRYEEAEAVYKADLERHPENGWALHGLAECLEHRGATTEAAAVRVRFVKAWARADVPIQASCYCRTTG